MLKLTPELLAASYELLRVTEPFRRWALPPADAVRFKVFRTRRFLGWFTTELGASRPEIALCGTRIGYWPAVLETMAHEMIHLYQWRRGLETRGVEHNADFQRRARSVCRVHGFDPANFVGKAHP